MAGTPVDDRREADFDALKMLGDPSIQRRRSSPERFWAMVNKDGPVVRADLGACWVWSGRTNADGYGLTSWVRRDTTAHRLAYALVKGAVPASQCVMHACDNPPCCNPDHLSLGTKADNNEDMRSKGRSRNGAASYFGARNHKSKLNDALVRELRAAWDHGNGESIVSLSARTGLATGTIHPMLHGRTWRHVAVEAPASGVSLVSAAAAIDGSGVRAGGAS